MKRVLISILGTVAGMTALLSFKTHSPAGADLTLPSAGLPAVPGAASTTGAAGEPGGAAPAAAGTGPAAHSGSTRSRANTRVAGTPTAGHVATGTSRHLPAGSRSGASAGARADGSSASAGGSTGGGATSTVPHSGPTSPAGGPAHTTASTPPPVQHSTTAAPPPPPPPVSHTYTGQAVRTRYGTVQVQVTMTGSTITNVSFLQLSATDSRSQQINANAGPILLEQTLAAQSAQIDGVSGATYTTQGYEQSLQSALDQA